MISSDDGPQDRHPVLSSREALIRDLSNRPTAICLTVAASSHVQAMLLLPRICRPPVSTMQLRRRNSCAIEFAENPTRGADVATPLGGPVFNGSASLSM